MLRQPSLKPVSLNKGFSFGCRPCFKSLSGFGWHGVTGGSRRGGCPAVRCRPVCTTLQRSGLRRDAHRRCNAQWVERRWGTCGSVYSGDFGSRALADAGISGKSGSGSSCLDSRPSTETSLGSILGMQPEFTSVDLGDALPRRFLLPPFWNLHARQNQTRDRCDATGGAGRSYCLPTGLGRLARCARAVCAGRAG